MAKLRISIKRKRSETAPHTRRAPNLLAARADSIEFQSVLTHRVRREIRADDSSKTRATTATTTTTATVHDRNVTISTLIIV